MHTCIKARRHIAGVGFGIIMIMMEETHSVGLAYFLRDRV